MNRALAFSSLLLSATSLATAGTPIPVVPEPGTFFLLAGGLAAGVLLLRKKLKSD